MEKRPDWYMFQQHCQKTVAGWVKQLAYFYFIRAWGGHANDGDAFKAGITFTNEDDLKIKLSKLGITIGTISPDDPQPVAGKKYPGTEFMKFKTPVYHFPGLEQPGHVNIAAQKVFVWVDANAITFSISGTADDNLYEVSEADHQACLKIEALFNRLNWQPYKDTSPEQSSSCVSKLSYPELYSA